ncbi:PH domain-containing protein [Calidifontimicrobium sp. SYSU G02091]|uniref:photosynthetic complex putative assembly protein PuhB n=1 Tax=Calidifontimicrobium sp. SYSU G02091 TaxID=2926421 RepID=UPI001F52CDB7|nr:photosynthetic complex putative assembly protein PuhB [Calidifontimicrobium sp. SYSU G02091]MCI1192614.1 PH domain-containing protein [Calidifontimicrobium sp. SYSU G02091]
MSGMEHDFEPVRGLPEALPAGEHIVWQGAPRWQRLAIDALHVRKVAVYFALLLAWRVADGLAAGGGAGAALAAAAWTLPLAAVAIGLLLLIGWLMARTTVYTLTNRRIVMRVGVVLGIAFNLPLARIASAALRRHRDGSGDIMLALSGPDRIAYLHLWPHARPWFVRQPQPMLRALADVDRVARLVADALAASAGQPRPALAEMPVAGRPVPAAGKIVTA